MTEKEKYKIQSSLPFWGRAAGDLIKEESSVLKNGFLFRHFDVKKSGNGPFTGSCRILFFTDLHLRSTLTTSSGGGLPFLAWEGEKKIRENLQESIDLFKPDLLLSGGDLAGEFSALGMGIELLRSLRGTPSRFAVMGNWDKRRRSHFSCRAWEDRFAESSFTLLCNEEAEAGEGIIYGLDDFKSGLSHYRSLRARHREMPPKFQLVLAHNPDTIPFLGDTLLAPETDLILCGHTHGGQILLPCCQKAVLTSTNSGNKLARGAFCHKKWGTKLIVSSGIGATWIYKRRNLPPEILGITLEY